MTTHVGHRIRQIDWDDRTAGRSRFIGDLELDGLAVGAILRSPHPHARIISIDTSAAAAIPGVLAVVTAKDLRDGTLYRHTGPPYSDRPPLASEVVRFVGQEVAAVAAVDRDTAAAALDAIEVRYRPLRAPLDVTSAIGSDAAVIHDRAAGPNLAVDETGAWGDVDSARAASEVSVEGTFRYPRSIHVCMEPSGTIARWSGRRLELWTTTQAPWYVAGEVAAALGIELGDVVCHDVAVGGGFGARSKIAEHEVITALLARRAGRPVRLVLSREEEFSVTKTRHRSTVTTRLHAAGDGRLCLVEGDLTYENGAYNHSGPTVLKVGVKTMGSLYRPEAAVWRSRLVDTALQPGGQFRGYGGPQMSFALETQVDEIAQLLGRDPIDLRIQNANLPGSVALCGARVGSARLVECLEEVRNALAWERPVAQPGHGRRRGRGVAAGMHGSGSFVGPGTNVSSAAVEIDDEGAVTVRFGSLDTGTGQRTVCAQLAAEELGVDPASITVVMGHDPSIPHEAGAWSSRGTHMAGHAVGGAAREMASTLRRQAADKWGTTEDAVVLRDGDACFGDETIALGELVAANDASSGGRLRVDHEHVEERMEMFGAENPTPNFSASYTFCAHGVEVEVDELTGELRIVDYVAAHDIGRAINPGAVEGQIIGGVVMGLGAVMGEELVHEGGRPVNPAYINYALPRAADVPDVRVVLVEGDEEAGPHDAKSVGELPVYPVAAAVANAVYEASGIRLRDLPFTPDKVLAAIAERDGRTPEVRSIRVRPGRWWVATMRWLYPRGLHALLHRFGTRFARRPAKRVVASVEQPRDLEGLVSELVSEPGAVLVAGNTDVSLQRRQGLIAPVRLVSTAQVRELRQLGVDDDGTLVIGAGVTLSDLAEFVAGTALGDAAGSIASPQIRNVATVGGNLVQAKRCWFFRNGFDCYKRGGVTCPCYAVEGDHRFQHAVVDAHRCQAVTPSDLATALTSLDASISTAGPTGGRQLPIDSFYSGPGETVLGHGEIISAVRIPSASLGRSGAFVKLNAWDGDFAMVSASISARVLASGHWSDLRIVLGAMAATPLRMRTTESDLDGARVDLDVLRTSIRRELAGIAHPLARNGWKLLAAEGVAVRAAESLLDRQSGSSA